MNLSDCTKADLLWIIKAMCKYDLSDRNLRLALNDLELLKPYEGMPLTEVPRDVWRQADAALAESRAANKQWAKLMGVKMK